MVVVDRIHAVELGLLESGAGGGHIEERRSSYSVAFLGECKLLKAESAGDAGAIGRIGAGFRIYSATRRTVMPGARATPSTYFGSAFGEMAELTLDYFVWFCTRRSCAPLPISRNKSPTCR